MYSTYHLSKVFTTIVSTVHCFIGAIIRNNIEALFPVDKNGPSLKGRWKIPKVHQTYLSIIN